VLRDAPLPFMSALFRLVRIVHPLACLALGLVAGAAGAAPAPTASYTWRSVVIKGGGFVSGLVYHPAEPNLLYARTDVGGAFRWDAASGRWIALNDNLGRDDAELLGVISLAVDPHDSRLLYLACGSYLPAWAKPAALLASADRGATWNRTPLPFRLGGNADGRESGERLQVDPQDGAVLLLGTNQDGLWRSADRGASWQRSAGFPAAGVTFVAFAPARGDGPKPTAVIYAGSADRKLGPLYRSADAGATWSAVPGQPTGFLIQHAAFDASGTLFLTCADNPGPNDTTDGAVWKLDPAAGRWTNVTPVAPDAARHDGFSYAGLALDPQHAGTVLVSTLDRWSRGDEIFRSLDGGATWKPLLAGATLDTSAAPYAKAYQPHWIGAVALDPFDTNRAFFTTGYGVFATRNATAVDRGSAPAWTFANDGLEEIVAAELTSPPAGAPLLSALFDAGGFRHDNLDASPAGGQLQTKRGTSTSIAFAEQVPAKMARTHSGPARGALSVDGGATWRDFATAPPTARPDAPGKIALSADGRRLVWIPKASVPYFSADDGATWTPSRANFTSPEDYHLITPVAYDEDPLLFYAYDPVSGRVFASTDGGASFEGRASLPRGGGAARAVPGREGGLWVPTPDGLFVAGDSDRTFHKVAAVQGADQVGFGHAAPGKESPAIFIAGRVAGVSGVFRSDDGGLTWMLLNDSKLQFGWINSLTGDPRVFGRVYVGTGGRGLFYGEPAGR